MITIHAKLVLTATAVAAFLCLALPHPARGQQTSGAKVYRGAVGDSHIQMRLNFSGNNVSGAYSYDSIGQDIKLTGHLDDQGRLELVEFGTNRKPIDSECHWSKPDGSRERFVVLEEQYINFTNGLQITPRIISNRKTGVGVSYPQLTSTGALNQAAHNFNKRILALVRKAIGEFDPIDGSGSFDTNYNVRTGTNNLVSIEMAEYSDGGGAHPNNRFWSLSYDLVADKEISFGDLFTVGSNYNAAIASYVVADIEKRAAEMEQENARSEGRKPEPRDGPLVSEDQLSELSGWTLTPNGLLVYFDFPHVMAVFDKTSVPYSVVKEHLKPNGPAARAQER